MQPPFGKNDVQILSGSFDDYSFDDVMQVLGLSRQCLRLKVKRGDSPLSEVVLKAGKVLDARMPPNQTDPLQVFQAINGGAVRGSGVTFIVYHTEPTGMFPAPCGELAELYDKVKAAPAPQPPKPDAAPPAPAAKAEPNYTPTMQIPASALPAPATAAPPQATPAPISSASDISALANIVAKMVLAELQPLIREELRELAQEVQEQAQLTHKLDGRVQSLPQVISAEVRAALAKSH